MANSLLDAIAAGQQQKQPLVWLDGESFGSRIVLNDKPFPWTNTTEFVSSYGQLQRLLKSGVAPLYVERFLTAWLTANSGALTEMRGKQRIRYAIRKLLGMAQPREQIRDIASALCQSVAQPLVLVFPQNGNLINWANRAANGAEAAEISDIDVDTVSVYLADFMRAFSGLDIAGIVIKLPAGSAVNGELLELYSPLLNVAKHYRWAIGIEVIDPVVLDDRDEQLDFVISNDPLAGGRILTEAFWKNGELPSTADFYFGEVPAEAMPEQVLERLAGIRRN